MHAAPARYVSVSELYSTDEVELLLDEIRDLEPTSCRGEDVQDFEIAGSGGGGAGGAAGSPAGTELTERSWDSHAQYRREPPPRPLPLAPLYCRPRYLLQLQGFCALLILTCSLCACGCVWGALGVRLGGADAGAGPARALQLGALSALLLHAALLALRLTALHRLMPLPWDALSAACGAWAAGWQLCGGALLLHAVLRHHARAPPHTRHLLFAAIGLSLASGSAGALVAGRWTRARFRVARARARQRAGAEGGGGYCAVPGAEPAAPPL